MPQLCNPWLRVLIVACLAVVPGLWWLGSGAGRAGPTQDTPDLALTARVQQFAALADKASPSAAEAFRDLAVPFDEIGLTDKEKIRVAPVAVYLGVPANFSGTVQVKEISKDGAAGKTRTFTKTDVAAWKPYEETALARVHALREIAGAPSLERLAVAQSILVGVWHFHLAQRDRPLTGVNPWQDLEKKLDKQLLQVRQEYLQLLMEGADGPDLKTKVLPLAAQLVAVYPNNDVLKTEAARARAKYAAALLAQGQLLQAEAWLLQAEQLRPDLPQVKVLRQQLQEKVPLPAGKPVLRVGVTALPEFLSPATAWTDAEKEAVELLFESLLQPRDLARLSQVYEPVLAAALPEVVPGGRRFTLRPDAHWSTGARVTVGDLRATIDLLRQQSQTGASFLWHDVLQAPKFTGSPGHVDFHFNLAFLDPLLPFTFKVLPQMYQGKPLAAADDSAFAHNPVGSGPFVLLNADKPGAGPVRFVVNKYHPYARQKAGFAEIQFHISKNPITELNDPKTPLHVILGLTEEKVAYLKHHRVGKLKNLGNRRVYYLAVNHRNKALQDRDLRKGLAAALDRKAILDQCFRGRDPAYGLLEVLGAGPGAAADFVGEKLPEFHRKLNGPFPADSWANKPDLPGDLHDPDQALFLLRKAKERLTSVTLTLAHPNDDPRVVQACKLMAAQLRAAALEAKFDLQIQLRPLPPRQLCEAVYDHDYDLAYFHWDYASEYYWLRPLFDNSDKALGKRGANFLGYDDAELVSLLNTRMSHQDFGPLRKVSHNIHAHLHDRMPLLPLWQLDFHVALHPQLDTGDLESWPVFTTATQWRLK